MKKVLLFICFLIGCSLFFPVHGREQATLKLRPDPQFGVGTDWESIFYDTYKSLAVGPDGSVFVSNSRQHNISKFSPQGKLVKTFGKQGQGPGDLHYPLTLSVLDRKYLVVPESPSTRRISIFDLDGRFVKILKAGHNPFNCTALGRNNIAFTTFTGNSEKLYRVKVFVKNIETGKETLITTRELPKKNILLMDKGMSISTHNHVGEVFIKRTRGGNLLVGSSNLPLLTVYSPAGKEVRSFKLDFKPLEVTGDYIRKYKSQFIGQLKKGKFPSIYMGKVKAASFGAQFGDHFPYYRDILVDADGNFLVFKWLDCLSGCPKVFRAYSPGGRYISETRLDVGPFEFKLDRRRRRLLFTPRGIYGLFQLKESEDISLRLVRVPPNAVDLRKR